MTKEEIELLDYFQGDDLACDVWKSKYQVKNKEGVAVEATPNDMHRRLAKEFARVEFENLGRDRNDLTNLSAYGKKLQTQLNRLNAAELENYIYGLFQGFKCIVPQGSIMSILGHPFKTGSLSNCLAGPTKVLTRGGYKAISSLANRTETILTKGGSWVEAQFRSFDTQPLVKLELSRGKSDRKVIECTSNHRWFLSNDSGKIKEVITSELKPGNKLHNTTSKGSGSYGLSPFGIAHGIVFGDGHTVKGEDNANNITLCGDSRVLGKYFINQKISSDESLCEGGSDFYGNIPNHFRRFPDLFENKAYLYGWLAGYFAADGNIDENGSLAIHSVDRHNIEFVQSVCGILGIFCGDVKSQTVVSNLTKRDHTMYKVFLHANHLSEEFFLLEKHRSRFNPTDKSPSKWTVVSVTYTGSQREVYCAVVPETHSFVIEGNILTGNCFVIPSPHDSYGGILRTDEQLVQLMKRRAGVGTNLNQLRPTHTLVSNAAGSSTGAPSFAERYSNSTREVAQEGRRGALMLLLSCLHPDIFRWTTMKKDRTKVTGANISGMFTDEFMKAAENNEDFLCRFPIDYDITVKKAFADSIEFHEWWTRDDYNKLHEYKKGVYLMKIHAKELFDLVTEMAWENAEPGVAFIDRIVNYSPDGVYSQFRPISCNPCGEQWLQAYDSCRLLALNLFFVVVNAFTKDARIDYDLLYEACYLQQRLADTVVDLEIEYVQRIIAKIKADPEPEEVKRVELELWQNVLKTAKAGRRTGCGFTALADMLAAVGLKYDSKESLEIIEKVCKTKMRAELDCSIDLAILREPFEGWDAKLEEVKDGEI